MKTFLFYFVYYSFVLELFNIMEFYSGYNMFKTYIDLNKSNNLLLHSKNL